MAEKIEFTETVEENVNVLVENGRITGELLGDEATEEKILELAMVDDLAEYDDEGEPIVEPEDDVKSEG